MRQTVPATRVTSPLRLAGLLGLVVLGCGGPQPLGVAIRPADRQAFLAAEERYGRPPKQAFLAARAAQTGRTVDQVAAADARISDTRNPFRANSDPVAVGGGAVIYQAMCLRCHGEQVRGGGPDMLPAHPTSDFHTFGKRFAVTLHGGAPRAWFAKISNGFGETASYPEGPGPAMPAFKDVLAREQIWQVITYLQSLDAYAEKP